MRLERKLVIYQLFRFLQDLALVYPVYVIMFNAGGLGFNEIARLLAIWAAAVVVLELPSGVLADLWSKPGMLGIGMLLKGLGFLVWWLFPGFFGFALGFVFWGAQEAFCSGTSEAWLYEALEAGGRQAEFEKQAGRAAFLARLAIMTALVLGGFVFSRSRDLTLALSVLAMLLGAVCAFALGRSGARGSGVGSSPPLAPGQRIMDLLASLRAAIRLPGLALYVVFGTTTGVIYGVLDEYDFIFGEQVGVPLALIGLWGGLRFMLEGLGAAGADRLSTTFALNRSRHLALWLTLAGLSLIAGSLWQPKVLLLFYFVFYAMSAAAEVVFQGQVQRAIASDSCAADGRATISSFVSLVYTSLGIALGLLLGWIGETAGLRLMFVSGGALVAGVGLLYALGGTRDSP